MRINGRRAKHAQTKTIFFRAWNYTTGSVSLLLSLEISESNSVVSLRFKTLLECLEQKTMSVCMRKIFNFIDSLFINHFTTGDTSNLMESTNGPAQFVFDVEGFVLHSKQMILNVGKLEKDPFIWMRK